jgi:hypothetical protein
MLFNIALAAAGFLGGWVLNNMTKSIERLDHDVREMPHNYVSREDFKDMREDMRIGFDKIDATLGTIFKRLERKEDKS